MDDSLSALRITIGKQITDMRIRIIDFRNGSWDDDMPYGVRVIVSAPDTKPKAFDWYVLTGGQPRDQRAVGSLRDVGLRSGMDEVELVFDRHDSKQKKLAQERIDYYAEAVKYSI